MKLINTLFIGTILIVALAGCASTGTSNSNANKSVNDYYNEAQQYIRVGDLDDAGELIRNMEIRYPFHAITHKLQLELAYAYSHQQRPSEAIAIANRFIAQYPYHERVDYAYYIKALTNFNQGVLALDTSKFPNPEDADARIAREAYKNFADLIRRFPDSQYLTDSKKRMLHLRNLLAQHEVALAERSLENNDFVMATQRAQYVLDNYPNTPASSAALNIIARANNSGGASRSQPRQATAVAAEKLEQPQALAAEAQIKVPPAAQPKSAEPRNTGPETKPNIHGERWLLAQNPRYYTIQLAGTTKKSWLDTFFSEKKLGNEAAFYTSRRKGQRWYTALYGSYPSYKAAKAAVAELEEKTGIKGLWIRKYKDIRSHILAQMAHQID
ncbi:MAG TPA: outer membrane protein assembly factor BamD [Candidatus Tenderia sp.]|nr:outer membrane protein assembly factor BamD [Candidatus Tenderia sp.]